VRNQTYRTPANRPGSGGACPAGTREGLPVLALLPTQQLETVFEPEYGFVRGTLFPELFKPLEKAGCGR